MKAQAVAQHRGGMWPWLMQRITAVLVLVTISIHLVATHLLAIDRLSYGNIAGRLAHVVMAIVDFTLLAAVTFHALNGARMVVLDYWLVGSGRRVFDAMLWVVGLAAFVYGAWALWPWVTG
jgi:succinate dehydrogenase / fumarate reductase cytochrome b subunit